MSAIKNFNITHVFNNSPTNRTLSFVTRSTYKEAKYLVDEHLKKQYSGDDFTIKVCRNFPNSRKWLPADIYMLDMDE